MVVAAGGGEAVDVAQRRQPGFVALDVDSLGDSAVQACRGIRDVCDAHVTMWANAGNDSIVVAGFRAGADDVLTGPRSSRELAARVRAALRRWNAFEARTQSVGAAAPQRYSYGSMSVDVVRREVRVAGERIGVTRTQFDILVELARRHGAVVTRQELIEAVWGSHSNGNAERVGVHIGALRRRLGDDLEEPRLVLNVRGVGYRLGLAHDGIDATPCGGVGAIPLKSDGPGLQFALGRG
ncbi:response regulator transcription factor [Mycolicibacterium sp. CAU 1645]|uniref:Response regulator transcription factor n=1 Tax=Mycolicibacterium arenosum TaxID=2952157 RepID=A0ABT1MBL1_9MYCO|nr:response regulator transcription factor [Mycolicibacterium sp. CAU 1645]MCP9276548.1 response regulator transcription factor [Mycolicibacterium sp. CAU 1645]